MYLSHFLAIRYMKAGQQNRFFSWITALSTLGIAIGVAALIVVLSVINGFEAELRKRFLPANAHIMAFRHPAGLSNPAEWARQINEDFSEEVKGIAPFVHYETMAKKSAIMHGVLIRGISPDAREKVQSIKEFISPQTALGTLQQEMDTILTTNQQAAIPSVIMGDGLLKILQAKVGDQVELIAPRSENDSEIKVFKVIGSYRSGLKHYDNRLAILSLPSAQSFFRLGKIVTGLEIGLHNPMNSVEIEGKMKTKYQLTFREWQSFNSHLFETMKKERALIAVIVGMVGLVAGLNILTTIFVSVTQKQRDISVLKSIGASNRQIIRLFINQGAYIGLIGGTVGGALAVLISWSLEQFLPALMELPDPYLLKTLPINYDFFVYLSIITGAILLCIIAGLYPAIIATKVVPSDGFRGNVDQ